MEWSELGAWAPLLRTSDNLDIWEALSQRVEKAYLEETVYPPRKLLFSALQKTPPGRVKVVILGQDPYHEPGQACGLSFSVPEGISLPRSLINIFKELREDLGVEIPQEGCLDTWAEQGCLLLNAVLTVRMHEAGSHRALGWEGFTDRIIQATNTLPQGIVFILWGSYAQKKEKLIQTDAPRLIIKTAHPSPLSAYRGFFGSRPFSRTNDFLRSCGEAEMEWSTVSG